MINIVIVDDDKDSANALKRNIHECDEIFVTDVFYSGEEVVKYCETATPDIILMDIRMSGIDGLDASMLIKQNKPNIKILFLTLFLDKEFILKAMKVNCEGFLYKGHKTENIISIIKNTFNGLNTYEKRISDMMNDEMLKEHKEDESINVLTQREKSIVKLITVGKTDAQIAKELFISEGYLRNTLVEIRKKVGVKNSRELAVWGSKRGM